MERLGRRNPRVKRLRRAVRERPPGWVVVDGRRVVEDLLRWGVEVEELYLAENLAAWQPAARARRTFVLPEEVLAHVAPTRHPQGVLALVREPRPSPWRPEGVTLALDGVQEPGNVGAVVRSAAALGASAVLLGPGSADPFHPAAVRGSAGAVFRIPVRGGADLAGTMDAVRRAGGAAWAAAAGGVPARRWQPAVPLLLLLGSEGRGLSPRLLAAADGTVSVPLARGIESLNVAVAASLLLWEAMGAQAGGTAAPAAPCDEGIGRSGDADG